MYILIKQLDVNVKKNITPELCVRTIGICHSNWRCGIHIENICMFGTSTIIWERIDIIPFYFSTFSITFLWWQTLFFRNFTQTQTHFILQEERIHIMCVIILLVIKLRLYISIAQFVYCRHCHEVENFYLKKHANMYIYISNYYEKHLCSYNYLNRKCKHIHRQTTFLA